MFSRTINTLVKTLVSKVLQNIRNRYKSKYGKKMPIILVAGTAGKTSQTLMINQFLERNGRNVLTGSTLNKNYNTVTGLGMVLIDRFFDFDKSFFQKVRFVFYLTLAAFFKKPVVEGNSILVFEVGFDREGESKDYLEIFSDGVDLVIVTAMTHEHSANYSLKMNDKLLSSLENYMPAVLYQNFANNKYEDVLKNTSMEQLNLLKIADKYIVPFDLEIVSNKYISNIGNDLEVHTSNISRDGNFGLCLNSTYYFNKEYLLPDSFAKFGQNIILLANMLEIRSDSVRDFLTDMKLPNSRFNLFEGKSNTKIVDSTYNSDPASLTAFLNMNRYVIDTFKSEGYKYRNGEEIYLNESMWEIGVEPSHYILLGEMRELGDLSKREHEIVLDYVIESMEMYDNIEGVVLLGRSWLECDKQKIPKMDGYVNYILYKDRFFKVYSKVGDIISDYNENDIRNGSWLWVKGSQNTVYLEEYVKAMLYKESDLDSVCRQGGSWSYIKHKWLQ